MKLFKNILSGFGLTEIVLAIGIFAMISSTLLLLVIDSSRSLGNIGTRAKVSRTIAEINSSLLLLKSNSWFEIIQNSDGQPKHILYENGAYTLGEGLGNMYGIDYYFVISNVNRDINGNLVEVGGAQDFHTRKIDINISWNDVLEKAHTVSSSIFLNDWESTYILRTTNTEFLLGTHNDSVVINNDGGEVRLRSILFPDWCNPTLSLSEYDIPGNAYVRSVFAQPGHGYLGTTGSSTGEPFTKLNIEGVDPPILSVDGTYSGHTVNDIFVDGDYAFLATATDSRELIILDVSTYPYSEVGYYDAPGSTNANGIFVDGQIGYLAQGRYVRSFDLSSYFGSRTGIGSTTVGGLFATVSEIYVYQGYLYSVLNWDWYELAILNVSNPASMTIISQTSVNNQQVYDMYVSDDATRVFFGTNSSSSENEFFILDTSQKTGSRPVISSLDTGGTTVRGIAVVENGDVVILVGTGGMEYKVYDVSNDSSPTFCGGMEVNSGIYDIDSNYDGQGNAFSYIVTADTEDEFKIIRGGPGGGGDTGYGYVSNGSYYSPVLDTDSETSVFYMLSIGMNVPSGSVARTQLRVSNNINMIGSNWFGYDGTSLSYFEGQEIYTIPQGISGRYVQYRILFESNTLVTPLFRDITIYYEK